MNKTNGDLKASSRGVRGWGRVVRAFTAVYQQALRTAVRWGPATRRAMSEEGFEILLTGTFYSDNWSAAHLFPLADCPRVARIVVVATQHVPHHPKIHWRPPPRWLVHVLGEVPARLVSFFAVGFVRRPHWVGGFHLLLNGMAALLLARLTGSRAMYFCVGGEAEVRDGGLLSENRLFALQTRSDPIVERRLLETVREFDLVLTMGSRARDYFRAAGRTRPTEIAAGGLDGERFSPSGRASADYDVVFVGRLVPIKRVDRLLETLAQLCTRIPALRALIVGDGPKRRALEALALRLGLARVVTFAGSQPQTEEWLRRARVFVLTSESEGLSLSLIEAMLVGLPAVVPRVGDLADLVANGVNGYLVEDARPESYAEALARVLTADHVHYARFAQAARAAALRYERGASARRWREIFARVSEADPGSVSSASAGGAEANAAAVPGHGRRVAGK